MFLRDALDSVIWPFLFPFRPDILLLRVPAGWSHPWPGPSRPARQDDTLDTQWVDPLVTCSQSDNLAPALTTNAVKNRRIVGRAGRLTYFRRRMDVFGSEQNQDGRRADMVVLATFL